MEDDAVRVYVGRRVAEARDLAGMKQEALAERLGIGATTLSMIETGHSSVSIERLLMVARVTGRTLMWFVPGGAGAPDVVAALQGAFPGITDGQILGLLDFARYLRSPESRIRADS